MNHLICPCVSIGVFVGSHRSTIARAYRGRGIAAELLRTAYLDAVIDCLSSWRISAKSVLITRLEMWAISVVSVESLKCAVCASQSLRTDRAQRRQRRSAGRLLSRGSFSTCMRAGWCVRMIHGSAVTTLCAQHACQHRADTSCSILRIHHCILQISAKAIGFLLTKKVVNDTLFPCSIFMSSMILPQRRWPLSRCVAGC